MLDGQRVHFGADSISTRRSYSRHAVERTVARFPQIECAITGSEEWGFGITGKDFYATRPVLEALHKPYGSAQDRKEPDGGTGNLLW